MGPSFIEEETHELSPLELLIHPRKKAFLAGQERDIKVVGVRHRRVAIAGGSEQRFLNYNERMNHLGVLLKCRF